MIYTSTIYANAEHTLVTGTDAEGNSETVALDHVIFRCPDDGPQGFLAKGGTIAPYVAQPELAKTRFYKSTLIRRMSPDEAASFEAVLQSEMPWLRMLYHSVEYFDVADALVGYMHLVIEAEAGTARADELLAPEV